MNISVKRIKFIYTYLYKKYQPLHLSTSKLFGMSVEENSITVVDLTEDESNNILDINYSRSYPEETALSSNQEPSSPIETTECDGTDPEMSPVVMGFLLAQIVRNFQQMFTRYDNSSNLSLIQQLLSVLKALDVANKKFSNLLSILSDKDKLDIEKEIERREQVFMKRHKEILKKNDELHQTKELLAVQTAKIDCKKELMECTICYSEEKDTVLLPCSHTFCCVCVDQLQLRGNKCAVCRTNIEMFAKVRLTV